MVSTAPYLDRLFSSVRLQYRAIGFLAGFAFLAGTIVDEIYGGRDLLDRFLLTVVIAGFFGVALATFQRDIADFQLGRLWLVVLLFGLVWQAHHNLQSNLSFEVALQNFVNITAACATLRRRRHLQMFLALSVLNVPAVSYLVP